MKLKRKTLMMIGSIVGVTTIGATVISTMLTSCSETAISNEQIELDDDYELNQAKFDFNEFYTMLISNDNNDYIVNERNGVTRDQITKVNEIQIFFDKLETVINTGLTNTKTTFHWYDYEPADLIQATLQLFRFAVLPIFDWFINDTFFMKFLLTDQQRADTTQWFIDMLDGKILIKE
jgi:hypothetical protein